jgi:hypothetical protein
MPFTTSTRRVSKNRGRWTWAGFGSFFFFKGLGPWFIFQVRSESRFWYSFGKTFLGSFFDQSTPAELRLYPSSYYCPFSRGLQVQFLEDFLATCFLNPLLFLEISWMIHLLPPTFCSVCYVRFCGVVKIS